MSQKYNSEYINELEAFFIGRNDIINRYGNVISHYLMLPGLIGFWPMATVQRSTGNVPNYAPTYTGATTQDLVYNGNPAFNFTATGVPYIDLDGTGDYLSVADNTDLDIQGNEAFVANPGITMTAWTKLDTSGTYALMSKFNSTSANRSFLLDTTGGIPAIKISSTGAAVTSQKSHTTVLGTTWHMVTGVWIPSTSNSIWVDNDKQTAVSADATIFNSTASFTIGAVANPTLYLSGNITLCALCACALSDAIIKSLFQQTRSLFGV